MNLNISYCIINTSFYDSLQDTLFVKSIDDNMKNIFINNIPLFIVAFVTISFAIYSLWKQNKNFDKQIKIQEEQFSKQFSLQTKYYKLAVEPFPLINYYNEDYILFIKIKNEGLGPLCILEFNAIYQGSKRNNISELLPKFSYEINIKSISVHDNVPIGQGKEIEVFRVSLNNDTPNSKSEFKELLEILPKITIELKYSDMYRDDIKKEEIYLWKYFGKKSR